jgi:hypothetical protein
MTTSRIATMMVIAFLASVLVTAALSFKVPSYTKQISEYLNTRNSLFVDNQQHCKEDDCLLDYYVCSIEYLSKLRYSNEVKEQISSVFRRYQLESNPSDQSSDMDKMIGELTAQEKNVPDKVLLGEISNYVFEANLSRIAAKKLFDFVTEVKKVGNFQEMVQNEVLANEAVQILQKKKTVNSENLRTLIQDRIALIRGGVKFELKDVLEILENPKYLEYSPNSIRPFEKNVEYFKVVKGLVDSKDELYGNLEVRSGLKGALNKLITEGMAKSGLVAHGLVKPYFSHFLGVGRVRITEQFENDMKLLEKQLKNKKYLGVQYELLYLIFQFSIHLKES